MSLKQDLEQFIGTEHWYRVSPFTKYAITDGVKYFADNGGAYWAVHDILATAVALKQEMLVAKVTSNNQQATIEYEDGNGNKLEFATSKYPYTDLQEGVYRFYVMDGVMLLPSEY